MDCIGHGDTNSQIQLSNFHFHGLPFLPIVLILPPLSLSLLSITELLLLIRFLLDFSLLFKKLINLF